ncbi:hypothetical protein I6F15_15945 [Bradyrhizobium sp. BRP14]|nr:hypothetical protein [Bradyrhizobium sp. BRP14]
MRITRLLHGQDHPRLDVAARLHLLAYLECLLQRHRLDLRAHTGEDAEVERLSLSWSVPVIDPSTLRSPTTRRPADTGNGSLPAPSSTSLPLAAGPAKSDDTASALPMVGMMALPPLEGAMLLANVLSRPSAFDEAVAALS